MNLNENLQAFLKTGENLLTLHIVILGLVLDAESQLQVQQAKTHRNRLTTIKAILERPEYDGKGIKALGPNETAQQQALDLLLDELEDDDYSRQQHLLQAMETRLALLKTSTKQIGAALKHWYDTQEFIQPLLDTGNPVGLQLTATVIEQAGQLAQAIHGLMLRLPQEVRDLANPFPSGSGDRTLFEEADESVPF